MEDERFYVKVGKSFKETRKSIGIISDLKHFIAKHFNLPHIQVTESSDGCVVFSNLFEGIPDDVENQDHEVFDNVLKLFGWVEGCIELPKCSQSVAPKVLEEMPADEEQISVKESSTSVIHESDLMNDDELLTNKSLEFDDVVVIEEQQVQMEATDEINVANEFSDLVAHQVFNEMPSTLASHEMKTCDQIAELVDKFLLPMASGEEKFGLKALKVSDLKAAKALLIVKELPDLIIVLIKFPTQGITMDHMRVISFDPGGGALFSDDTLCGIYELVPLEKNSNLWCIEGEAKKNLIGEEIDLVIDHAVVNSLSILLVSLGGGQLLIPGVSEQYAAMEKFYLSFDELVRCTVTLLQLRLGHHFTRPEMMVFDPGGEQLWLIGMVHKCVRRFISNYCLGQLMKQRGQGDYVKLLPVFNPRDKGFMLGELGGLYLSRPEEFSELLLVVDGNLKIFLEFSNLSLGPSIFALHMLGKLQKKIALDDERFSLLLGINFDPGGIYMMPCNVLQSYISDDCLVKLLANCLYLSRVEDLYVCLHIIFDVVMLPFDPGGTWSRLLEDQLRVSLKDIKVVQFVELVPCLEFVLVDKLLECESAWLPINFDFRELKPTCSFIHLQVTILIFDPGGEWFMLCKVKTYFTRFVFNPTKVFSRILVKAQFLVWRIEHSDAYFFLATKAEICLLLKCCNVGRYNGELTQIRVSGDNLICTSAAVFENYIDGGGFQGEVNSRNGKLSWLMFIFPLASYFDTLKMVDGTRTVFVFDPGIECSRFNWIWKACLMSTDALSNIQFHHRRFTLGVKRLILGDKDRFKQRVLLQGTG